MESIREGGSFCLECCSVKTSQLKPLSQSLPALPAPLIGEPLAGRAALRWMLKVSNNAKDSAPLQRAAASGQVYLVKLL